MINNYTYTKFYKIQNNYANTSKLEKTRVRPFITKNQNFTILYIQLYKYIYKSTNACKQQISLNEHIFGNF